MTYFAEIMRGASLAVEHTNSDARSMSEPAAPPPSPNRGNGARAAFMRLVGGDAQPRYDHAFTVSEGMASEAEESIFGLEVTYIDFVE